MPTKHIDDATFALAEENLVKAVMLTHTAVKESEMLALLIRKGAQTITPLDILTQLPVANAGWNVIFSKIMDECAAQYPEEYISTPREFSEMAEKHSATWKEYRNDAVHQHICDAGKRLQKLSEFRLSKLEPEYELDSDDEKQHHEKWLRKQIQKMDDALNGVDGSALGSLKDDERELLDMMMESTDFQVSFQPLPDKRRSDGRYDFSVHASRFPNMQQSALLGLLDDLKATGLKLSWSRVKLNEWLQEHAIDDLDELVFGIFSPLNEKNFTLSSEAKPARHVINDILKKHGVGLIFSAAVIKLLDDISGGSKE